MGPDWAIWDVYIYMGPMICGPEHSHLQQQSKALRPGVVKCTQDAVETDDLKDFRGVFDGPAIGHWHISTKLCGCCLDTAEETVKWRVISRCVIYIYIHVYNISPRLCQHSPGFYMRLCHEDGKGHMFFPSGWILSVTCTSSWLLARYFAVLFPWKAEFWESQMHLAPWTTPFCWQLNELPLRILKILNSQHFFRLIPCHTGKILVFICWFGLIKILYLHLC